jgi:thiosulfate dehydrogenase [quinone] large subunit
LNGPIVGLPLLVCRWIAIAANPSALGSSTYPPRSASMDPTARATIPAAGRSTMLDSLAATRGRYEYFFIFAYRIFAGWLFFYSSLSNEIFNPLFVATHVVPVVKEPGVFYSFFTLLAAPEVAPAIGFCVMYGHLLIGLSLLSGFMVRVSASAGTVLMILYWLVGIKPFSLHVVGHATVIVPLVLAYRVVLNVGGMVFDIHILWSIILIYVILSHAGHVWGLDAWAVTKPFLRRLRIFD